MEEGRGGTMEGREGDDREGGACDEWEDCKRRWRGV